MTDEKIAHNKAATDERFRLEFGFDADGMRGGQQLGEVFVVSLLWW